MVYSSKEEQDVINDILLGILDNVNNINDANVGSVLRNFVESVSSEIDALYSALDTVYAGTRIDTATSTDLEQLGLLVGIERNTGLYSDGNVTMKRTTPASADFVINSSLVVSTQPNTGEEQLRYAVTQDTTFLSSVAEESHTYADGLFMYGMNERFIGNTSSVSISAIVSGVTSTTLTNDTDFAVIEGFNNFVVDESSIVLLDDCDTADWTESTDATADATSTTAIQGDYSLKLGKSGTTSSEFSYAKTLAAEVNGSGKEVVIALYFANQATIDKISSITAYIGIGGSISNSYQFSLNTANLAVGWKKYRLDYTDSATTRNNSPNITAINHLKIKLNTKLATDTVTSGSVLMDYWCFADTTSYEGDVIKFFKAETTPDDDTEFLVDYTPLSKEVPIKAESVGLDYNVNKDKIVYKVSNISGIASINNYLAFSGGTDTESDDDLRTRILFASELQGKATEESIRQAVLGVDGVASCTVDAMPLTSITSETFTYSNTVDTYNLDREVLYLDDSTSPTNITVTGTASSTSKVFEYGTDFTQVLDGYDAPTSQIKFTAGGTSPDDSTVVTVDYQVEWLGHVDIIVSGDETPIPTDVDTAITTAVEETRAAGITTTIYNPTTITVNVTASITADTTNGYTFAGIEQDISDAVYNLLIGKAIGEDVFVSEVIQTIMDVTGVANVSVSAPAADVTIATDEIATSGTITITEA